jgi:hypothetical protein
MRGLGNRQGMAAVVIAADSRTVKVSAGRPMFVHRLPHAAGMRRRHGDGQGHRGKDAHEHKGQQQPGGQRKRETPYYALFNVRITSGRAERNCCFREPTTTETAFRPASRRRTKGSILGRRFALESDALD